MTTSTHGQPSPLPWLSLPSCWPCNLSAQARLSSQTELGTFQGGQEREGSDSVYRGLDPRRTALFWQPGLASGPGVEPREDLGLSPHPPCHVFITSKCRDLAPCPRNSSHRSPVGELPPASGGDRGCPGWGRPPVHILRTNPPGINSLWFCFYFNFFVLFFFLNKNFHFKHIYTEGICAVYWGSWISS